MKEVERKDLPAISGGTLDDDDIHPTCPPPPEKRDYPPYPAACVGDETSWKCPDQTALD